jgi:formylglycine-generating enzyme required for sulfatase activity
LNAGYWTYATQSDTPPGNIPGTAVNEANYMTNGTTYSVTQSSSYVLIQNYLTDVGAFGGSPSAYGTFDQSGNVQEWNDLAGAAMNLRGIRGGFCFSGAGGLSSAYWDAWPAANEGYQGFRLSSPVAVPEPSTYAMALAGLACGGYSMWRRRKRA